VDRHPLDIEPLSGRIGPQPRCERRAVCPAELAACLVVLFLVVALAGPTRVAAGAGGMVGVLAEMVGAVFDAGGFLRPSW
jgi:hypothetical protein